LNLTGRFFAAFGFIQILGIASGSFPGLLPLYAVLLIALLLAAWADYRSLAGPGDFRMELTPPKSPRLSQAAAFQFKLDFLTARARRLRAVQIQAPLTDLFEFKGAPWRVKAAGEAIPVEADTLRLGHARFDRARIWVTSGGGIFQRAIDLPVAPVEVRVAPESARLSEQKFSELLQSQHFFQLGARQQVRSRAPDQVYTIRRYQYPDPLRHIDHKKTARFGEPMTRTFDSLRNHHLVLVVDQGRAMAGEIRGSRKIDYYLSAALLLAENAIASRDEVSLISIAQSRMRVVRRTRNIAAFHALFRAQNDFQPRDEETNFALLPHELSRLTGSRAIVLILTDMSKLSVQESLLRTVPLLAGKHLTVVAGLNDREIDLTKNVLEFDANPKLPEFEGRYAKLLYSYWMNEKHDLFQRKLARFGAGSLSVNDAYWMTTVERIYQLLRNSRLA
jgi:uncharacterized protein (DUF58 family)